MKRKDNTTMIPPVKPAKEPLESNESREPGAHSIKDVKVPKAQKSDSTHKKHSLFGRKSREGDQLAEEKTAAVESICKKSGLSEDDIAMMFELGYENELGRLIGYDNVKVLKAHLYHSNEQEKIHGYRTSFAYRGKEFTSNAQKDAVLSAYVYDRKFLILRLLLTALCTLILFFVDQPNFLVGTSLEALVNKGGILFDGLGLLLLVPVLLLSHQRIYAGLRSFFHFSATPYSFPALLAPVAVVYDVVALFMQEDMLRINFLVACVFLLMALCDTLRLSNEIRTLRLISADGQKQVLSEATPKKKKLRRHNKIVKIVNDDLGENIYEVRSTEQIDGFFRRFNTMSAAARPFTVLIACMFAFSVFTGFVSAVYTGSVATAFSLAMTVLTLSMPMTFFFAFFYPLTRANRILAHKNCTLLGEESVQELEGEKTVVFRDTLLYNAERYTEIDVREGDDLRNDMRLASALFRKLGGTLKPLGTTVSLSREDPHITIVHVQDFGVEALVDNQRQMLLGSAEYLRHAGIKVPSPSADSELRRTENVCVTYLAIDGVLKLSYEIEYQTKPQFEQLISDLVDGNVVVAISSCDPNLNDLFLQKSRPEDTEPVAVRKPNRFEEEKPLESADTPVVALGSETDVTFPLYAAKGIHTLRRFAWRMQLISSILGVIAVLLLTFFKPDSTLGIMPILGYQALWVIVFTLSSHAELTESHFRFNR